MSEAIFSVEDWHLSDGRVLKMWVLSDGGFKDMCLRYSSWNKATAAVSGKKEVIV